MKLKFLVIVDDNIFNSIVKNSRLAGFGIAVRFISKGDLFIKNAILL